MTRVFEKKVIITIKSSIFPNHEQYYIVLQNVSEIFRNMLDTSISSYISDLLDSLDQGREKAPKAPEPKAAGYNGRATGAESSRASREQQRAA